MGLDLFAAGSKWAGKGVEGLVFAIVDKAAQRFRIESENSHCCPSDSSGLTQAFGGTIQNNPTLLSIAVDPCSPQPLLDTCRLDGTLNVELVDLDQGK